MANKALTCDLEAIEVPCEPGCGWRWRESFELLFEILDEYESHSKIPKTEDLLVNHPIAFKALEQRSSKPSKT